MGYYRFEFANLKKYEEAIKEFDTAISLNPENPNYYYTKGLILSFLERYEEALLEYDKAINLDPNNPDYHYDKGISFKRLRLYYGVIKEFDMAIKLDPNEPLYLVSYAEIMAIIDNAFEGFKRISDALYNGLISRKELYEVVCSQLNEAITEKEEKILIDLKEKLCK
ncbi:tetratricopeptide repeat protein [Caldiplasma sukawensis]